MIALLQRVSEASVTVCDEVIGRIGTGLLVLVGVQNRDRAQDVSRMAERIAGYRVFGDLQGRMNLSVKDIQGELLLVPQFTLAADTDKGMRPSFHLAADPETGRRLFGDLVDALRAQSLTVSTGRFAADMKVGLVNDGPVTFWLSTHKSVQQHSVK